MDITVGVLALQGAFREHLALLKKSSEQISRQRAGTSLTITFIFQEVRNTLDLSSSDALIIPGGESTTMALVASRSGLLDPLRDFVKIHRKPTWGTCAGLILLAESANRTKQGGQDLIGGLDVRVNRNHFGRQAESFVADLNLPFLEDVQPGLHESGQPFRCIFIRAPIVEKILPYVEGEQEQESKRQETVVAPSRQTADPELRKSIPKEVEVLGRIPRRSRQGDVADGDRDNIIAVRQGNVIGTSFHPELTDDTRIHTWWLLHLIKEKLRDGDRALLT